jgi:hypothetical protein
MEFIHSSIEWIKRIRAILNNEKVGHIPGDGDISYIVIEII